MVVEDELFQSLVDEAWESIPEKFRNEVENVVIAVEDWPTKSQLRRLNIKGTLLGLFDGVPKTGWGQAVVGVQPSKITIFKNPILQRCRTIDQLRKMIRDVMLHEVGHYFGYDEKGIRELERKSKK